MDYFLVSDIAQFYGISTDTVRLYDKKGIIPARRLDNGYRVFTREDLISYGFITFLREMDLSLNEICNILDNKNIDELYDIINTHASLLTDKIDLLEKKLSIALKYKYLLEQISSLVNIYRLEIMPPIIYQDIDNESPVSTAKEFSNYFDSELTIFSFLIDKTTFLKESFDMHTDKRNFTYAITLKDEQKKYCRSAAVRQNYQVIESRLCLVCIIDSMANENYHSFNRIRKHLDDVNYTVSDDILLRHLFSRGYPKHSKDYYEIIIPIKYNDVTL